MDVKESAVEYLLEAKPQTCMEDVPPGYKRTEVGVIPEDWLAEMLGKYATFRTGPFGSSLHRSDYVEGGVPIVNPMQIIGGGLVPSSSMSVSEEAAKRLSDFRLPAGSVVIGRRGDMGRCAFVDAHYEGWLCGTGSIIIRPRPSADGRFLQRLLSSHNVIAAIENSSVGTTMVNLNQGTLAGLLLALPPTVAEQRAIATALSDADALITALQRLIAKKRAIKQGTMQSLLTGRQRLPGFTGEWKSKPIHSLLDYERPERYIVSSTEYLENGSVPVLTANKSFILGYTNETWGVCENIPAIIFDDFTTDSKYVSFPFKIKSSAIKLLRPTHEHVNLQYVFERMQLIRFPVGDHRRYYISDYQHIELPWPDSDEQTAIATVLADMDAEIEALEARLAKTRALKAGMMQQLLTGRIRLPLDDVA